MKARQTLRKRAERILVDRIAMLPDVASPEGTAIFSEYLRIQRRRGIVAPPPPDPIAPTKRNSP